VLRLIALLVVLAQCCTILPASAYVAYRQPQTGVTPCGFADSFLALHGTITELAEEAREAGNAAVHLRRTSLHAPYRHIEVAWFDVSARSKKLLQSLSDIQNALDRMRDGKQKAAAFDLVTAYQSAVPSIVDYAHFAVYDERRMNAASMRFYTIFTKREDDGDNAGSILWISPGTEREKTRTLAEVLGRKLLDQQILEIDVALQSLRLPEYRYGRLCPNAASLSAAYSVAPPVNAPCDLVQPLADAHAAVEYIADKVHDAAYVAKRLHHTSRWRPYKHVETSWSDSIRRAKPTLDALSDIAIKLEALQNNAAKRNAVGLVATYQSAILQIVDYEHNVLYYERITNGTGNGSLRRGDINFGVTYEPTKSSWDNYARNAMELSPLAVDDALRSLKLSEYRYHTACRPFVSAQRATISNPCTLAAHFFDIHKSIVQLGNETRDMGNTALRLRQTSRWLPYKRIENEWLDITGRSNTLLNTLSDFPVELDQASDGEKKDAALQLTAAYQNALGGFIDYARSALYFENTENKMAFGFQSQFLRFGLFGGAVATNRDNIAHANFDANTPKANEALRLIRLPEHHYARLCNTMNLAGVRGRAHIFAAE
jgi:hypothetical protein